MGLQNFVDKVGPPVKAAFLNAIDALINSIFADANSVPPTTKAQARTNLTLDAPLEANNGGTSVRNLTSLAELLGVVSEGEILQLISNGVISIVTPLYIVQAVYPQTLVEQQAQVPIVSYFYPPGNVQRYGADPTGTVDSRPAFVSAFKVGGLVIVQGTFKILGSLTIDISKTTVKGPGQINIGFTSGILFVVNSSQGPELTSRGSIQDIFIQGPGNSFPVVAIQAIGGTQPSSLWSMERVVVKDTATALWISTNAFEINCHCCTISACGNSGTQAVILDYAGSERNSFSQCAFFNNINFLKQASGGQAFFEDCSFDYTTNNIVLCQTGQVFLEHCYIESNQDNAFWFTVDGTNPAGLIKLDNCMIAQTGNKPTFNYFSSAGGYGGGIYVSGTKFFTNSNAVTALMCAGTGNAFARNNIIEGFLNNINAWGGFGAGSNVCSNGTFVNGLAGWVIGSHTGSGGNPTVASNTLLLQVTQGGQDQFAIWTVPGSPGENIGVTCKAKANNANCGFSLSIHAVGADGIIIGSSTIFPAFNGFSPSFPLPTSFTSVRTSMLCLPVGTATVQIELNTNGATNNANIVSVQSVLISKY